MKNFLIILGCMFLSVFIGCQKKEKIQDKAQREHQEIFEQQLREYKRILEVNPRDLEILTALGNLYYDMGQWDGAVDNYLKALAIDSTNVDVRTDMGTAYKRMGMLDLAIREYKKGLEINPKHAKVHYNLGVVYYEQGKYKESLSEWETYYKLEQDPQLKEAVQGNIEKLKLMLDESKSLKSITPLADKK